MNSTFGLYRHTKLTEFHLHDVTTSRRSYIDVHISALPHKKTLCAQLPDVGHHVYRVHDSEASLRSDSSRIVRTALQCATEALPPGRCRRGAALERARSRRRTRRLIPAGGTQ